ncbi:hypothetical protein SERLA73DRAFT_137347, partial [Serpula lacrymans var. lacrymans S7.3]
VYSLFGHKGFYRHNHMVDFCWKRRREAGVKMIRVHDSDTGQWTSLFQSLSPRELKASQVMQMTSSVQAMA